MLAVWEPVAATICVQPLSTLAEHQPATTRASCHNNLLSSPVTIKQDLQNRCIVKHSLKRAALNSHFQPPLLKGNTALAPVKYGQWPRKTSLSTSNPISTTSESHSKHEFVWIGVSETNLYEWVVLTQTLRAIIKNSQITGTWNNHHTWLKLTRCI